MSNENFPSIFFFPGIGCELIDLEKRPNFIKFDKSVSLAKEIASCLSNFLVGRKLITGNKQVKEISKKIFKKWEICGGKTFNKEEILKKERSNPNFSFLSIKENRLCDNRIIVNWIEIETLLENMDFYLEKRESNNFRVKTKYPIFIFVVKNKEGSVISEGKGFSEDQAKKSAMAEAIERIFSDRRYYEGDLVLATQKEILNNEAYKINFESGKRDVFSNYLVTEWISAYNFSRRKQSWIPAELAFMGYVPKPGIKAFCLHHTTGLSVGSTFEEATANGIFEIIERDAYWNVMRCRLNCPDIEKNLISQKSKKVYDFLKKQGFKLVLKDISLNWPVYVVHATLIDKKEYMPAFSHGTGSSFSLKEATEKAISEAIQVYSGLSEIAKYEKNKVVNVEGVIGNCRLAWLDPLIYPHIKHLISKNKAKTKRKKTNSMNELIKLIKKENHEVLSSKIVEVGDLTLVRTYITGATHPDDRLERISKKLEKNIKLYCPRGAYWDPILI